jgi:hypothetical protein
MTDGGDSRKKQRFSYHRGSNMKLGRMPKPTGVDRLMLSSEVALAVGLKNVYGHVDAYQEPLACCLCLLEVMLSCSRPLDQAFAGS